MEKELLEQVIQKLKGFGLKRWTKRIGGSMIFYLTETSNFEIVVKKDGMGYDLKIKRKNKIYDVKTFFWAYQSCVKNNDSVIIKGEKIDNNIIILKNYNHGILIK